MSPRTHLGACGGSNPCVGVVRQMFGHVSRRAMCIDRFDAVTTATTATSNAG